jgi:hypothetical protein
VKRLFPFFLLAVAAAAAPVTFPADCTAGLGMNIHFTDPRPGELEMMTAAGVRWVRMDFSWGGTERQKEKYDFAAYERLLAALDKHGVRALFILDYGNKLYEPDASVRTAAGREAFARWAAAAVSHFKGRGIYWEIWNEPNGGFWKPKADVAEYSAMALAACKAMRAAAPDETIIGPATSTIDLAFIEGCGKAGLFDYWDAISVHPYRQEIPESVALEYATLRRLVAKYRERPILSGEWGYSSAWQHYDAEKQGKMLPREWLINIANGIPVSIWYDWHEDGTDPKEPEHHFGTVENAYRSGPVYVPKPAYTAAKALTTALRGSEFLRRLSVGGAQDYVLLFRRGAGLKLAAWTTVAAHPLRLPGESELTLNLTDAPQYLDLPKGDAKLATIPARPALRAILQPSDGSLQVRLENPNAEPFTAEVRLTEVPATAQPITLAKGEWEKSLSFPLEGKLAESFRVGVQVVQSAQLFLEVPPRQFTPVKAELFTGAKIRPDGDAKVASEQTLSVATAPEPPPGGNAEVLRLRYKAAPGWKFFLGQPSGEAPREIAGQPQAFGMWIHGDGQGCHLRLRVVDASGQTWQPSGPRIDWKGWRYVELPLNPETAHWGGKKEGGVQYPLHWDSLFLVDSPRESEVHGELYFTRPWVIE